MSTYTNSLTIEEAEKLYKNASPIVCTYSEMLELIQLNRLSPLGKNVLQGASDVIQNPVVGSKVISGSVVYEISYVSGSNTELLLVPFGALGSMSIDQLLVSSLACLSAKIIGYKEGDTIEEAVNKIGSEFRASFENHILENYPDGIIPAIIKDGKSYVPDYLLNDIKDFFIESGVYNTVSNMYNVTTGTEVTINSLIAGNYINNRYAIMLSSIKDRSYSARSYFNNIGIPTIGQLLNAAESEVVIYSNDLIIFKVSISDNYAGSPAAGYTMQLYIIRNAKNASFDIDKDRFENERSTNYPAIIDGDSELKKDDTYVYLKMPDGSKLSYTYLRGAYRDNITGGPAIVDPFYGGKVRVQQLETQALEIGTVPPSKNDRYNSYYNLYLWNFGDADSTLVPGVMLQVGQPIPTNDKDIGEIYSDWSNDAVSVGGIDSNGDLVSGDFFPVSVPTDSDVVSDATSGHSGSLSDGQSKDITEKASSNIADSGSLDNETESYKPIGENSVYHMPSIAEIGMIKIYVPTYQQLKDFTSFLWAGLDDLSAALKKILQNPMDAIISLHRIYINPGLTGTSEIILGKKGSGVSANYTMAQYCYLDCGEVSILERYNDATDYSGFTSITIYLPFIGFQTLDTNDIMGGLVHLEYIIDILTGNCVANIHVTKNNVKQLLYSFAGNCAEQVPLTGANYSALILGATSAILSTGAAAVTGGLSVAAGGAGAVAGAVGSAIGKGVISSVPGLMGQAGHTVQRSGNIGGSFGALSNRKPYFIITRTVNRRASYYNKFYGYPSNTYISLNNCSGFTKVKSVHLSGIYATETEKQMIEAILKEGIII